MEERKYIFEPTTLETRSESYETVDKAKRHSEVLEILENKQLSAKEVAIEMYKLGYTNNADRNNAAPRLHELHDLGEVEVVGKKVCEYSGKKVAVYSKKQSCVSLAKYNELLEKFNNLKCIEAYSQSTIKQLNNKIKKLKGMIKNEQSNFNR